MRGIRLGVKGFTLLEILIVLVILAVLAGLAIPAYQSTVEKSRQQEALTGLSAARESMMRYYATSGTYVGAGFGNGTLDYDPNTSVGGQTPIFAYTLSNLAAGTFTITATRQGGSSSGTVTINQAGVVTKTGVYL